MIRAVDPQGHGQGLALHLGGGGRYALACARRERQFIKLHGHSNGMKKKEEFVPCYPEAVVTPLRAHYTSFIHTEIRYSLGCFLKRKNNSSCSHANGTEHRPQGGGEQDDCMQACSPHSQRHKTPAGPGASCKTFFSASGQHVSGEDKGLRRSNRSLEATDQSLIHLTFPTTQPVL